MRVRFTANLFAMLAMVFIVLGAIVLASQDRTNAQLVLQFGNICISSGLAFFVIANVKQERR